MCRVWEELKHYVSTKFDCCNIDLCNNASFTTFAVPMLVVTLVASVYNL